MLSLSADQEQACCAVYPREVEASDPPASAWSSTIKDNMGDDGDDVDDGDDGDDGDGPNGALHVIKIMNLSRDLWSLERTPCTPTLPENLKLCISLEKTIFYTALRLVLIIFVFMIDVVDAAFKHIYIYSAF